MLCYILEAGGMFPSVESGLSDVSLWDQVKENGFFALLGKSF